MRGGFGILCFSCAEFGHDSLPTFRSQGPGATHFKLFHGEALRLLITRAGGQTGPVWRPHTAETPEPESSLPLRRQGRRTPPRASAGGQGPRKDPDDSDARAGMFGITFNTLVRSSQSSSGPAGGASDAATVVRAGTRSCGPGPPVYDYRDCGRGTQSHRSGLVTRTDPSVLVCPIMLRHRYR